MKNNEQEMIDEVLDEEPVDHYGETLKTIEENNSSLTS